MDSKLKAIKSNNIDNDQIDLIILNNQIHIDKYQTRDVQTTSSHICSKKIPVIFSTKHGVHLRTFSTSSSSSYGIQFCDLERWVSS